MTRQLMEPLIPPALLDVPHTSTVRKRRPIAVHMRMEASGIPRYRNRHHCALPKPDTWGTT